jgi:hypothetical protein
MIKSIQDIKPFCVRLPRTYAYKTKKTMIFLFLQKLLFLFKNACIKKQIVYPWLLYLIAQNGFLERGCYILVRCYILGGGFIWSPKSIQITFKVLCWR